MCWCLSIIEFYAVLNDAEISRAYPIYDLWFSKN